MRPRERRDSGGQDLFRARLDQIIDLNHELAKLARAIDWGFLEEKFGAVYTDRPGRPPLPTRLMVGLAILNYTFNLSDEAVVRTVGREPVLSVFLRRGILPARPAARSLGLPVCSFWKPAETPYCGPPVVKVVDVLVDVEVVDVLVEVVAVVEVVPLTGVLIGDACAWAGTMTDSTTGLIHFEGSKMVTVRPPTVKISRTRRRVNSVIDSPQPRSLSCDQTHFRVPSQEGDKNGSKTVT
jgi:hypothetical protein